MTALPRAYACQYRGTFQPELLHAPLVQDCAARNHARGRTCALAYDRPACLNELTKANEGLKAPGGSKCSWFYMQKGISRLSRCTLEGLFYCRAIKSALIGPVPGTTACAKKSSLRLFFI